MSGYCFDTSSLIECWTRTYPPDVVPGLWDKLEGMIAAGEILCPDEVRVEIKKQDDGLGTWLSAHGDVFLPLDEPTQIATTALLRDHGLLMKATKNRNGADPFVIATAQVEKLTVVTEERGGTDSKPKIPSVCAALGVECIDTLAFIREQGWSFS